MRRGGEPKSALLKAKPNDRPLSKEKKMKQRKQQQISQQLLFHTGWELTLAGMREAKYLFASANATTKEVSVCTSESVSSGLSLSLHHTDDAAGQLTVKSVARS